LTRSCSRYIFIALGALCLGLAGFELTASAQKSAAPTLSPSQSGSSRAAAEFRAMLPVLHHPRCMNCHSHGDFPRQGDDSHPHTMDVHRGSEGHGANAVLCSTCHQDHNLPGLHTPPGAPGWALPSPGMPMIWEGLSASQLCQVFKDPRQNGHRTVEQIVEHMSTPLVLWGWDPGGDRTPIPTPKDEFLNHVKAWASHGAACP
jgi:hypothetical protein